MMKVHLTSRRGFTLLEVILTVLIGVFLATVLFNFTGEALRQSGRPIRIAKDEAGIEKKMEEIISRYVQEVNDRQNPDAALVNIQTWIAENYPTATTQFITFDANGNEQAVASGDTLKVAVQDSGHRLVALLTNSRNKHDMVVRY